MKSAIFESCAADGMQMKSAIFESRAADGMQMKSAISSSAVLLMACR